MCDRPLTYYKKNTQKAWNLLKVNGLHVAICKIIIHMPNIGIISIIVFITIIIIMIWLLSLMFLNIMTQTQ